MEKEKKGWLDGKVGKFVSRKFLVWIFASVALLMGVLEGDNWVAVALAFIGIEGAAKVAAMWKHGKTFVDKAPHEGKLPWTGKMDDLEVTDPNDPERMDNTL